jgi:hypothetical protein
VPRASPTRLGGSFVVTNTSSRARPLSRRARPTSASLPYMVAVSMCRYPVRSAYAIASYACFPRSCQVPKPTRGISEAFTLPFFPGRGRRNHPTEMSPPHPPVGNRAGMATLSQQEKDRLNAISRGLLAEDWRFWLAVRNGRPRAPKEYRRRWYRLLLLVLATTALFAVALAKASAPLLAVAVALSTAGAPLIHLMSPDKTSRRRRGLRRAPPPAPPSSPPPFPPYPPWTQLH